MDYAAVKVRLLELRDEIISNPDLRANETDDLKAAILLLIMHLNHRINDEIAKTRPAVTP